MQRTVDWYYHRVSDDVCTRADAFLKERGIEPLETVNARKIRFEGEQVERLLGHADRVIACRDGGPVEFDMQGAPPSSEDLEAAVIGPSGCLRSPSAKVGSTWLIGFDPGTWDAFFG